MIFAFFSAISRMRMKSFILIYIFLLATNFLYASKIVGKISTIPDGEPISGANIYLEDTVFGSASDDNGDFELRNIPPGEYTLIATYIGYRLNNPPKLSIGPDEQIICHLEMEEDIYQTDDIVITGTRSKRLIKDSPVSTEVIHADEIINLGAKNVGEVLEERAGIIITQDGARGGILSAQLQGLNDEHTLILVDGVPIIGRIAGQLDLSRLSVQNIQRIEIVKGAASSLYGSEAVGGVVHIITKDPEDRFDYFANGSVGSFEARNARIDLSLASKKTSALFTGDARQADGYDLDPTTANTTVDAFKNISLFSKLKYKSTDYYSIHLSGEYFNQRQVGFDGGDRITDTQTWYLNASNDWILENQSNFKFRLYHTSFDKAINRAGTYVKNIETLSRAEFVYNRVIAKHILTIGGEGSYNRLQSNRVETGEKAVKNLSMYAQDEMLFNTIEFNAGLRVDYHSEFQWHLSPKIGFLFKPTNDLRIRGSFANGFRAPNFIELYLDLDHSGLTSQPYIAFGNPDLQPETSRSLNFGLEYHFSQSTIVKANMFYNHIDNMINSKQLPGDPENPGIQYYTYENISEGKTQGFEFDSIFRFWTFYRLTAGYAFTETLDLANDKPFYNRPKHSGRLKLDWDFREFGFSGNFRWRYIGERLMVNIHGEEIIAPWYALWNTRLLQRLYKPLSVFVEVNNIFDYQNRDYVALPGRIIFVGIELN
jgi:outer membrane receptor for ferrienterochelin and colicins